MDNNVSKSTYTSRRIIPGRRAGNIQQIINGSSLCNNGAVCPSPINSKIIKNSNPDVIPFSTQTQRAVNAIRYASGGRIIYGNAGYNSTGVTFLGRTEGQPGGTIGPLRNKF